VGWAGGSSGPDFFIYLGDGPATWLGAPHDGTVFAEVADEESMAVARSISLLPVLPYIHMYVYISVCVYVYMNVYICT